MVVDLVRRVPGWEAAEPTITPIIGGITNRNFRVDVDGRACVVRIPGERTELLGIDRAGEAEASRRAAALGLAPAVVAELPGIGTLVTEFVAGKPATSEDLVAPGVLEQRRRVDPSPARAAGRSRARFPIFRVIERHARDAAAIGASGPVDLSTSCTRWCNGSSGCSTTGIRCSCHNDLLPANVLLAGDRHWLIDFEYAGMNEDLFDLANLSVELRASTRRPTCDCSLAYDGDASVRRLARLSLMKVVSEMREGMWAIVQESISTLDDVDFGAYARERLGTLR